MLIQATRQEVVSKIVMLTAEWSAHAHQDFRPSFACISQLISISVIGWYVAKI